MGNTFPDGSPSTGTDLTTVAAVKLYLGISGAGDDVLIGAIVTAASRDIERATGRHFWAANYSEWYDGRESPRLMLNEAPIIYVTRAATGRQNLLNIANQSDDAARAMVRVSAAEVTLIVTGGADAGTTTLTFAANATITALAAAVNALTNWTATVPGDASLGNHPSSDLTPIPAWDVANSSWGLIAARDPITGYRFEAADGILIREHDAFSDRHGGAWGGFRGGEGAVWPGGQQNVFVEYRAGWATLPADLEMAARIIAANAYRRRTIDLNLDSEKLGDHSWKRAVGEEIAKMRDDLLAGYFRFKLY